MDEYRKKKLGTAIEYFDGNIVLDGQFSSKDRATIQYEYPKYSDILCANAIDLQDSFYAGAKNLSKYRASIIVTDARYARFGLCPNRFIEALAVGSIPFMTKGVLDNCEQSLIDIYEKLKLEHFSSVYETDDLDILRNYQELLNESLNLIVESLELCMQKQSDII
jgi:hypothetical protein